MKQRLEEPTRYSSSPGFSVARRVSNQIFLVNQETQATFTDALINDNGCFNFSTHEFVCPKAGRMSVSALFLMTNSFSSNTCTLIFRTTNANLLSNACFLDRRVIQQGTITCLCGTTIVDVNVGSTLRLGVYPDNVSMSTFVDNFNYEGCLFSGFYLP